MFLIAVSRREIPDVLIEQYGLLVSRRNASADEEVLFSEAHRPCVLPAWLDGQLLIVTWAGWIEIERVRQENWRGEALIPATFGCERGIWFTITGGIRAVVQGHAVLLISQPASHYYAVMTRASRMPLFAGDSI
jgi:hypothetical protein